MLKRNMDIREAKGKIPSWLIAERLGIHVNTFYAMMRKNLKAAKRQEIIQIIHQVRNDIMDGVDK